MAGRPPIAPILSLLAAALLSSAASLASDWPQFRGPNVDGVSTDEVVTAPAQLWTQSIGAGYSSVVIKNDRVYTVGHVEVGAGRGDDTVRCLDAANGNPLWTYTYNCQSRRGNFGGPSTTLPGDLEDAGPRSTPCTDGVRVYTLSLDGHLHCLDAATGELVWYRNVLGHLGGQFLGYGFCTSPIIWNDKLLLDIGGTLVALDKATGAEVWRRGGGGGWCAASTPVPGSYSGTDFVVYGSRFATGVRLSDGALLWSFDVGREQMTTPIVSANKVFTSGYPDWGRITLRTVPTAAPSDWVDTTIQTYHLTNVLVGGYLYVMDNAGTEWAGRDGGIDDDDDTDGLFSSLIDADELDSSLRCIDITDGTVMWTKADMGWAHVVVADDELLILRETGELRRVQVNSGSYNEIAPPTNPIGQWCWTAPALASGRLYVRKEDGADNLVCLSVAPAVTVVATDPMASENGGPDTGTFTISRVSADNSGALTVNVALSGTGTETTCYTLSGGAYSGTQVTIPAGQASVDVTVTPVAPDGHAADETVILTVTSGAGVYTVGWASAATVQIVDSGTSLPSVSVTAAGADGYALEGGPAKGAFTVTRSAAAAWPLTVDITLVASTAGGADYSLAGSDGSTVTIAAGQTDAVVIVTAAQDGSIEGNEIVDMAVVANATFYTVGAPASATVTVVDVDDPFTDGDGDGMDDDWERSYFGDTGTADGSSDSDGDSLNDVDEYIEDTHADDTDTDKDGGSDGAEVLDGTDPLDPTSFTSLVLGGGGTFGEGGCGCALTRGAVSLPGLAMLAAALGCALVALRLRRAGRKA